MKNKLIQTDVTPELYEFVAQTAKAKGLTLKEAVREALRVGNTRGRSFVRSVVRPELGVRKGQEDGLLEGGRSPLRPEEEAMKLFLD
jgi:hypothetical protein